MGRRSLCDRWMWEGPFIALFVAVPAVCFGVVLVGCMLISARAGRFAMHFWVFAAFGIPFAVVYSLIGFAMGKLRNRVGVGAVEVSDCLIARNRFVSPGVAALYADRLELTRVTGRCISIGVGNIVHVRRIQWFNNTKLIVWKIAFEITLADRSRVHLAVPRGVGLRWENILGAQSREGSGV